MIPNLLCFNDMLPDVEGQVADVGYLQGYDDAVDKVNVIKCLQRGHMGAVYKVKDARCGETFALKRTSKKQLKTPHQIDNARHEVDIMRRLQFHPNIVTIVSAWQTQTHMYIKMECCRCDLWRFIQCDAFTTKHARLFLGQLAKALQFMHVSGIVHRDVKPENILISHNTGLKLGDFGLACTLDYLHGRGRYSRVGTLPFMSPEMKKKHAYGTPIDVWAMGVIFFEMLTKRPPFDFKHIGKPYRHNNTVQDIPQFSSMHMDKHDRHLVLKMLTLQPKQRITASGVSMYLSVL